MLSKTLTLTEDRNFSVKASGYDQHGNKIEASSETIEMRLLKADAQTDLLGIAVKPSITQLDEPGTVTFSITVSNKMEDTLTDVVVSEQTRGDIAAFDSLVTGDKLVSKDFEVTGDETFVFTVSAKDPEGNKYDVRSGEVKILVGAQLTATPAVTAAAAVTATGGLGTFLTIVIIIVGLIVLATIVLIVLLLQEKKAKKLAAANPQAIEGEDVQKSDSEEPVADEDISFIPPEIDDAGSGPEIEADQESGTSEAEPEPEPDKEKRIDDIENPVE
jgi:hypothetical protein